MRGGARVAAVIFDFDGVLADTEGLHCEAFRMVAAPAGVTLTPAAYVADYLGLPDRECLAALWARAGRAVTADELDALVAAKRRAYARLARAASLYPGIVSMLQRLAARVPLAIASGAFRDEIEPLLERSGVRALFAAVVGAEDVRAGKPAPDPFLTACARLATALGCPVPAAACVVVEDSPRGVAAAHAAGMRCVAVTTSHAAEALRGAEQVLDHARDLRFEDLA